MMLNKVDLPQPDGPITARNSPGATVNDTLSSAVTPSSALPKRMIIFSTTSSAGPLSACGSGMTRLLVDTAAMAWPFGVLISGARHRLRHDRGIARLDADIDDGDVAGVDFGNRLFQRRRELGRLGDRAKTDGALGAAHGGEIDFGLRHALADPLVLDRAIAHARHPLLVQFVVIEGTIVGEHEQQRNFVMHRGPHRGDAHQKVAVAADRDRQAAGALERQRGADRNARSAANAAAAVGADIVERMLERRPGIVPRQWQMRIGDRAVLQHFALSWDDTW